MSIGFLPLAHQMCGKFTNIAVEFLLQSADYRAALI